MIRSGLLFGSVLLAFGNMAPAAESGQPFSTAQSVYLEYCGGCHGLQGVSAPHLVPSLRGQVGRFLCTEKGRAYVVRLPSLARSPFDDELLAQLVNFVVFDLGGGDAGRYKRYTPAEVAALRRRSLFDANLTQYRGEVVRELIERCGAPRSLQDYSGPR